MFALGDINPYSPSPHLSEQVNTGSFNILPVLHKLRPHFAVLHFVLEYLKSSNGICLGVFMGNTSRQASPTISKKSKLKFRGLFFWFIAEPPFTSSIETIYRVILIDKVIEPLSTEELLNLIAEPMEDRKVVNGIVKD
jgi:hypothetical protein